MRVYNKLVRDRIPELIRQQGETPVTRRLNDGEYTACLREKLQEEVAEFLQDETAEELCDILEVVDALFVSLGVSPETALRLRKDKAEQRGRFEKRLYLEYVE